MKEATLRAALLLLTTLLFPGCAEHRVSHSRVANAATQHFVGCGKDNLVLYELTAQSLRELWRWNPAEFSGMPKDWRRLFWHIDECIPLEGGSRILITASTDGIGIVDRDRREFTFIGTSTNAHSIAILPKGTFAVAASNGGDELVVFDGVEPEKRIASAELIGGHGVVWLDDQQALLALGEAELKLFTFKSGTLRLANKWRLPEFGGHNLSTLPGTDMFEISTNNKTWLFNLNTEQFLPHPLISNEREVKSMSRLSKQGSLLWVQAEERWWSYSFWITDPDGSYQLKVADQFYKARWIGYFE